MPDGNPLVAPARSQTTAVTGIGIAESATDLANGVKDGSWVEGGLGAVGVGLEVLSLAIDPIGTLAQYGVSWLIEHVKPLKDALDWLAGDPPVIQSFSDTWANVAKEVNTVADDLGNEAMAGTAGWTGQAGDAYRSHAAEQADAIAGAATLADGISTGVMVMGQVVAMVRETVRDLVAELIGRLISWALEEACSLGFATPLVAAQATTAITKTINKVSDLIRKLVKTIGNVAPKIKKIIAKLQEIIEKLAKLGRKLGHGADSPHVHGPDGTAPASAHSPGSTPPSSTTPSSTTPSSTTPSSTTPSSTTPSSTTPTHATPAHATASHAGADTPDGTSPAGSPNAGGTASKTPSGGKSPDSGRTPLRDQADDPRKAGRDPSSREGCGDPVDPATGEMFTVQKDLRLPGTLPLILERGHVSSYRSGRLFGPSWASTLDQRLEVHGERVYYAAPDGVVLVYPRPTDTSVLPVSGAPWPLTRTATGGYIITRRQDGVSLHFERPGDPVLPITAITDRNGNRIDFDYRPSDELTEIRHSGGYRIRVEQDNGLVTALFLVNPNGPDVRVRSFRYDDAGRLVEIINSSGRPTRLHYDHAGRIVRWEDRNGEWYGYTYDSEGRVVRTDGSGGVLASTFDYDPENRTTRHTDSLGHTTTYEFDEAGHVIRETDPLGNAVRQEWNNLNRIVRRTDPLGRTVRIEYDERGNITTLVRADGERIHAHYNGLSLPTVIVEPGDAVRRNEYDERGNLIAVTDPLGAVTRFVRDARGRLVTQVDALGNVTRTSTNAAGLPLRIVQSTGATTTYVRDLFGRPVAITDPVGATTRFEWTVEGKLIRRIRPDGSVEHATYDAEGNEVRHVDALGNVSRTETTHFDLPRMQIRPDGTRTEITYDTELRPVSITDSRGGAWTYSYDPAGRLVRERDVNGLTIENTYDAAGQLVERRDSSGGVTRLDYDVLGNVVQRSSTDVTTRFTYDRMRRIIGAVNQDAEVSFELDLAGRVLAETVNGRTVRFAYDPLGRLTTRRTPTGADSTWEYGTSRQPTALRTAGRTITFGYDQAGNEVQRLLDTGVALAQAWDGNGRLTAQTISAMASDQLRRPRLVQQRRYTYRADGHVVAIDDHLSGNRRLELDTMGRITAVHRPGGAERYAYDEAGALVAAVWPGQDTGPQGIREYQGSLVQRAGDIRYRYDHRGRVVMRQRQRLSGNPATWRYDWNSEDRLVGVTTPDGTRWRYRYDPLGRRIAKERLGVDGNVVEAVEFTWDGAQLVEQVDSFGRATTWNTAGSQPLTQTERVRTDREWIDAQFYSIVTDLVGTPTEMLDTAGTPVWRAEQTVWGRALAAMSNAATLPLRAPGQYFDAETGLHYNLNRYYDPDTGRYQSTDPLGAKPGPDPHAYVHNPVVAIDPAGLAEMCPEQWNERGQEVLEELDWTHGEQVASGVHYQFERMDPATNTPEHVASHTLPGIGRDPYAMADYFRQFEGRPGFIEFDQHGQRAVTVHYDPGNGVLVVENDRMIHAYRMSADEWARHVREGRYVEE